jgi:hypothetical protein
MELSRNTSANILTRLSLSLSEKFQVRKDKTAADKSSTKFQAEPKRRS